MSSYKYTFQDGKVGDVKRISFLSLVTDFSRLLKIQVLWLHCRNVFEEPWSILNWIVYTEDFYLVTTGNEEDKSVQQYCFIGVLYWGEGERGQPYMLPCSHSQLLSSFLSRQSIHSCNILAFLFNYFSPQQKSRGIFPELRI